MSSFFPITFTWADHLTTHKIDWKKSRSYNFPTIEIKFKIQSFDIEKLYNYRWPNRNLTWMPCVRFFVVCDHCQLLVFLSSCNGHTTMNITFSTQLLNWQSIGISDQNSKHTTTTKTNKMLCMSPFIKYLLIVK